MTGGENVLSFVGCTMHLEISEPCRLVLQVAVATGPAAGEVIERMAVSNNGEPATAAEVGGSRGARQHMVLAKPGLVTVDYQASVAEATANTYEHAIATDGDRIIAMRPSRYCPSDRLDGFALSHFGRESNFGRTHSPAAQARAICDYVFERIAYVSGSSESHTDAIDTLLSGRGVCRDFAHLTAALCRSVDIPARIVAVYAPGLSPMDLHVVVETEIDGRWCIWDSTRLAPRQTLVRIATGRDAADLAFATLIPGTGQLTFLETRAVAATDLPYDGHSAIVYLA